MIGSHENHDLLMYKLEPNLHCFSGPHPVAQVGDTFDVVGGHGGDDFVQSEILKFDEVDYAWTVVEQVIMPRTSRRGQNLSLQFFQTLTSARFQHSPPSGIGTLRLDFQNSVAKQNKNDSFVVTQYVCCA